LESSDIFSIPSLCHAACSVAAGDLVTLPGFLFLRTLELSLFKLNLAKNTFKDVLIFPSFPLDFYYTHANISWL
jgi:hypothetical protein